VDASGDVSRALAGAGSTRAQESLQSLSYIVRPAGVETRALGPSPACVSHGVGRRAAGRSPPRESVLVRPPARPDGEAFLR
jgi:hypothetical protein